METDSDGDKDIVRSQRGLGGDGGMEGTLDAVVGIWTEDPNSAGSRGPTYKPPQTKGA